MWPPARTSSTRRTGRIWAARIARGSSHSSPDTLNRYALSHLLHMCSKADLLDCISSFYVCEQHSTVLIRSLLLEQNNDYLYIGQSGRSTAERTFTGQLSLRTLENGEMGVALVRVDSNVVNVTFVSDSSVESEGFELYVFGKV